jgi:hypothetical protein
VEGGIMNKQPPWYYSIPPSPQDAPCYTWTQALDPPPPGPLEAQVEHDVETAIKHADERRLSVWRGLTLAGIPIWEGFRKLHTELDDCWKYRRKRYLLWRAAALKTMRERALYRADPVDGKLVVDKLLAACCRGRYVGWDQRQLRSLHLPRRER